MVPVTRTGSPESIVGEKRACSAAATAAFCKSGWPETARAFTTFPVSSIVSSTTTLPCAPTLLAFEGYTGFGRLTALLLSKPPETGVFERADSPADAGLETSEGRSEEHTSELQSRQYLVCRLLLEKKKKTT